MQATIETIKGVIFEKKEYIKKLNEDQNELIRHLSLNYQTIAGLKVKVQTLENELHTLYSNQSEPNGLSADCTKYPVYNEASLKKSPISEKMGADNIQNG